MHATEKDLDRMAALNAIAPKERACPPFCATLIEPGHGGYWLSDPQPSGFGRWYPTLEDCFRYWRIVAIEYDATAGTWTCEPAG